MWENSTVKCGYSKPPKPVKKISFIVTEFSYIQLTFHYPVMADFVAKATTAAHIKEAFCFSRSKFKVIASVARKKQGKQTYWGLRTIKLIHMYSSCQVEDALSFSRLMLYLLVRRIPLK
jgi:hypothetical protein